MSTATASLTPVSADLPVADETGTPVYVVEYRDTDRHETVRIEFATERDAVRALGSYMLYVNTEPLARGANVDPGKYRH